MANKVDNPTKAPERSGGFDPSKLRPSEFMRARRPERFADSKVIEEAKLTAAMFEYQLDTLTSRKQETEFEHFARRLADKGPQKNLALNCSCLSRACAVISANSRSLRRWLSSGSDSK
jgi:hypothetical protein